MKNDHAYARRQYLELLVRAIEHLEAVESLCILFGEDEGRLRTILEHLHDKHSHLVEVTAEEKAS